MKLQQLNNFVSKMIKYKKQFNPTFINTNQKHTTKV